MADSSVSIKITGSPDDLLRAFAEISASADATADDIKAKFAEAGIEVDALKDSADGAGGSMDDLKTKSDSAGEGMSGMMAAALALAPALGTVGAVGTGALIGVAGALANAGIGLGAFALAAGGVFPEFETQAKQMVTAFQQANQAAVMPALQGALPIIQRGLALIAPTVAPAAGALEGLETRAQASLGSPFWAKFSTMLSGQTGPAITSFGTVIGGTIKALAGLDEAFSPLITRMEGDLDKLGGKLAAFGSSATGSAGIQGFIAYVEKEGPVVASTLEDVGKAFQLWVENAAPIGSALLPVIQDAAKALVAIENAAPGLVTLATGLLAVAKAGQVLAASGLVSGIRELPAAFAALSAPAEAAEGGLTGLAAKASVGALTLEGFGVAASGLVEPAGLGLAAIVGLSGAMSHFSDSSAGVAQTFATSFVNSLGSISDPVQVVTQEMNKLGNDADAVYAKMNGPGISDKQFKAMNTQFQQLSDESVDLYNKLPNLKAAEAGVGAAMDATATQTAGAAKQMTTAQANAQSLNAAVSAMAADSQATSSAISTLNGALQELSGNSLNAQQATLSTESAIQSMTSALKTNGTSMDSNTQKGLANSQAALTAAQSIHGLISALAQNGETAHQISGTVQGYITQLDNTWSQAGLTKGQIAQLNAQYKLTPTAVSTEVTAAGAAAATAQVNNLRGALSALQQNWVATVTTYFKQVNLGAQQGGIQAIPAAPGTAIGGVFTTAQVRTVAEAGPEIVLPLTDPTRMAQLIKQAGPLMSPAAKMVFTEQGEEGLFGVASKTGVGGGSLPSILSAASLTSMTAPLAHPATTATGTGDLVVNLTLPGSSAATFAKWVVPDVRNLLIRGANKNATAGRLSQ